MIYWSNLLHIQTAWRFIRPKSKKLYKFHRVNEFLYSIIDNSSLWAGCASTLNDPYDCNFQIAGSFFKKKYLDKISSNDLNMTSSEDEFELFRDNLVNAMSEEQVGVFQQKYKSQIGVCSFTTTSKSELMWSHYADSAKGVCLEFAFENDSEINKKINYVSYSNKTFQVKNELDRFKAIFNKRKVWSYEKEYRMLSDIGHVKFDKSELIGVIFGPRTSQLDIEKIIDRFHFNDYYVKFYRCKYDINGLTILDF